MAQMSTRIQIISRMSRSATAAAAYRSGSAIGRSAVSAAAYRAGENLVGHDGVRFDYTRKGHVEHREILAPEGSPAWVFDRQTLWEKVDAKEKRKDAQLAREFRVMLPRELSPEQHIELARRWVQKHFVDRGMIADLCLHNPPASDGHPEGNPHFHVMLPMRPIINGEFGNKTVGARMNKKNEDGAAKFAPTTDWNDQTKWKDARDDWAVMANQMLAQNGSGARVDARSYADRGIDRMPQPYLGVAMRFFEKEHSLAGKVREYSMRMRGRLNQWMAHRASSRAWGFAQQVLDARVEHVTEKAARVAGAFDRFVEWIDDANTRLRDGKLYGRGHMNTAPQGPDNAPDKGIDR